MISLRFIIILTAFICSISSSAYTGTYAKVTFTLHHENNNIVVCEATVDLADRSTIPLLFSTITFGEKKPWLCHVGTKTSEDQLGSILYLTIADSSTLLSSEKVTKPLTLFSGSFKDKWAKGSEITVFKSGARPC